MHRTHAQRPVKKQPPHNRPSDGTSFAGQYRTGQRARSCRNWMYREHASPKQGLRIRARANAAPCLSLRELLAATRLAETDLLAFDFARISRHQTSAGQRRLQRFVVIDQCTRKAMAHRARLARLTAAVDVDLNVERLGVIGQSTAAARSCGPFRAENSCRSERPLIMIAPLPRFRKTRATELLRRPVP